MIVAGSIFTGLGVVGAFVPVLPTTPFLLLAAACYARSSQRFYHWLLNNRWLGSYVRIYIEKRGVPLRVKLFTIALLWLAIGISAAFAVESPIVRSVLLLIAVGVTVHVLLLPTAKRRKPRS